MAIDLFGWMATLSRASAAAAEPGTPPAALAHEMALAKLSMRHAAERVAAAHAGVMAGEAANGDAETMRIAGEMLAAGRYLPAHPLRV